MLGAMPEQLTRHPDATISVLKSAGGRCGEGLAPQILRQCPPERFCALPGGEVCVYGIGDARAMTQIGAADWQAIAAGAAVQPPGATSGPVALGLALLLFAAGVVLGAWLRR